MAIQSREVAFTLPAPSSAQSTHEDASRLHAVVDGLARVEGPLVGDSGAALVHALGRITAELHADDMRSFLPGPTPNRRTGEQRAADALLVLVDRLDEALTGHSSR